MNNHNHPDHTQTAEIAEATSGLRIRGPLRILVIRPDRLGDVILSTPVFEMIKRHYPRAHLTVLAREGVMPLLKGLSSIDHFMTFDPDGVHSGIKGFFRLYSEIRCRRFRIAVVLQSYWKIAFALFLARIRYRLGPLSKPHSFLFYNRGSRQKRSHVEMHEADYNLQILRRLGIRAGTRNVPTRVHIAEGTQTAAKSWLQSEGWDHLKAGILIHPGMGGSALNWPELHYIELVRSLVEEGKQVLVTGGVAENELLDRIEQAIGAKKSKVVFFRAKPDTAIDFFGALCNQVSMVVAPSTGPLHLAVALGKPVLTFYPPIRVQSALRWGPYLQDESKASVLVPEVYCGQDFECLGNFCNYFPCMKSLTVKQAIKEIHRQLAPHEKEVRTGEITFEKKSDSKDQKEKTQSETQKHNSKKK